jgi:hypothetical protein
LLVLIGLRVMACAPGKPIALEIDHTIERRRGKPIVGKAIYCHPVRSSTGTSHKVSGLRRLSLMLLVPVPWAGYVWALLTALLPGARITA